MIRDEQSKPLRLPEARSLDRPPQNGNGAAAAPNGGYYGVAEEPEANHFREYLRAVRKHVWLIIGITLIITTLSAIYMARQPDIYSAQARVQVDLENNPASGVSKNNTVIVNSPTSDPAYFNTQLQNLTSQGLLRRVVKTLDLEHNDSFLRPSRDQNRSTWQNILRMVGLGKKQADESKKNDDALPLTGSVAPATAREDLVAARQLDPYVRILQAGLKVEPVKETRTSSYSKDTRLIDIRYTHSDPQVAAKIVNAVADTFVFSNLEKKTENTANTGDFLQRRVAELQSQIRSSEERLVNYAKNHQILSLDGSQNTVVERLAGLNQQLMVAENERKTAEAAFRAAQSPEAASALAEGDARQLQEIESKLAALKQRRQELLVENTEEWPEVKEVTQQIATLEKQATELRARATRVLTTNLETRYRQALDRERAIRADFEKQRSETVTQNESAINYRIIQQEIETNKQLLNGLLQRSKENDVLVAGTPNNIYVVDYALASDTPIGPQRLRTIIMALLLALSAGVGLAIFLEYMNDSVRSTEDVTRWLQLPTIGVIPGISALKRKQRRLSSSLALERRPDGRDSPELLLDAEARSPLGEAYRHLRTSVLLATAGHAPRTLLVTSSMPSEGKTTTAVNTALSLAQTGARVLVIDADMRRPRLHTIFGLNNEKGLSSILSSELSEAEFMTMVAHHEESDLYILPSGRIPPNPAELIGSEQMLRLIKTFETTFTHVIIDSPPIGSFTDGVLAATLVDGVLLVVHSGKTPRGVIRRSRQLLQDVGAKVFGVVLNNVDIREHDYYYYRSYYSHYYSSDASIQETISSS